MKTPWLFLNCLECKTIFQTKNCNRKFCCNKCSVVYTGRERRRDIQISNCLYCKKVLYTRNKTSKRFCSNSCVQKWRHANTDFTEKGIGKMADMKRGKTYDEIYGVDKALELKAILSERSSGEKNGMFGKSAVRGRTRKDLLGETYEQAIENNSKGQIKHHADKLGLTVDQYQNLWKENKKQYYRIVDFITSKQPIHLLENFEKRGRAGIEGAYHLDHKIPRILGFVNNIDPYIIGNLENLRFITWQENLSRNKFLRKLLSSYKLDY